MNDDFISPKHGKALHEAYAGDKDIFNFEGDHNSARPEAFYEKAAVFFNATLHARGHDREEEDAFTFSHTRRPGHDASNTDAGALGRVHSVSRLDLMPPDPFIYGRRRGVWVTNCRTARARWCIFCCALAERSAFVADRFP